MQVTIEYCMQWNYEPRALAAKERMLRRHPDASFTLKRAGGGVFEVTIDGRLAYSKKKEGRFPTEAELDAL